jgi:hypothetical protein
MYDRKSNKKNIPSLVKQMVKKFRKIFKLIIKSAMRSILRVLMALNRRGQWSRAGFVLPTVTMVMLVVILLTIAISLRSFDRAQDARNVRVSQAVLSAATPALDRARAKLEELLVTNPPTTDTPTDDALYLELTTVIGDDKYTFGDEQRLQVSYDIKGNDSIDEDGEDNDDTTIEDDEITETAWRFPVDTDNNGEYDSFTVYGIFFRTPERDDDGNFKWARTPLDARTPPMPPGEASQSQECNARAGTSSSLVGDSGWYQSEGKLKKSFFVYTVTVPITDLSVVTAPYSQGDFETFTGTTGFSALEYQQDWKRIPLTNNAVVYEDDLEIYPGPEFRLNGRIQANSNMIVSSTGNNDIEFYLVSGKNSCFFQDEENSKMIVGGNVINGLVENNDYQETIDVHLQQGTNVDENGGEISQTHESVSSYTTTGATITNAAQASAYNSEAYANRIGWMRDAQIAAYPGWEVVAEDPAEVQKKVDESTSKEPARKNALETYFKKLVRKVPFAEVPEGDTDPTVTLDTDGNPTNTLIEGTGDELRPKIASWVLPTDGDLETGTTEGPTKLTLDVEELEATNPAIVEENDGNQYFVGDRLLVGNNLPQKVWDDDDEVFTSSFEQLVDGATTWLDQNGDDSEVLRYREPRVATIADVGSTDRDGFWEDAAATAPEAALDGIGGLRVITGAGVYERENSFLPPPPTNPDGFTVVWPDTMPMSPTRYSTVYDNKNGVWTKFSDLTDTNWIDTSTNDIDWTNLNLFFPDVSPAVGGLDPNTKQYAKGDLRMRATAVYHYAEDFINDTDDFTQRPIACTSSYYDPSTNVTAAASDTDTNGIVYGPPPDETITVTKTGSDLSDWVFSGSAGLNDKLAKQANMVFPDGRFVNEKLRSALATLIDGENLSLSEQAAIDTTLCAFGILESEDSVGSQLVTLGTKPSYIEDGAIKEIAFLDSRQIKASDPDNPDTTNIDESFTIFDFDGSEEPDITSEYDLSLEERQPMEIRATQIDLDVLRQAGFEPTTSVGPRRDDNEYLLPFSGIIYASRDDALPDRSDPDSTSNEDLANSPYDYKLDPSRRPNGIMLINGETVARPAPTTMTTEEVTKEKGLTLVSNLPVYIQGDFNVHKNSLGPVEEFNNKLDDDWGDFYSRTGFNGNFACRADDPRLSACTEGDNWRAVNILADTLTLLSDDWRPGFRNEGDFDLRNNAGNGAVMATQTEATKLTAQDLRRHNGFYANNYATNGLSSGFDLDGSGTDYAPYTDANYSGSTTPEVKSSYFNNFVTPVQRRVEFNEYVMEVCLKLPVSACEEKDWVVGEVSGGNITGTTRTVYELFESNASFLDGAITPGTTANIDSGIAASSLASGTTATPAHSDWQRFPRRVAFLRNKYGELEMTGEFAPVPIGVDGSGNVKAYFYQNYAEVPRPVANALWFKTTSNQDAEANKNSSYDAGQLLYYLGYKPLAPDASGNKPVLPPLPTIEIGGTEYSLGDEVYKYSACIGKAGGRDSQEYFLLQTGEDTEILGGGGCSEEPTITTFRSGLFTATSSAENDLSGSDITADTSIDAADDANNDDVVVVHLPGTIGSTATPAITLTLTGDANTIFVLRRNDTLTFDNVTMELDGVDPNNVFWVVDNNVTFSNETQHIVGNFLGSTGGTTFKVGQKTYLRGVRILGFNSFQNAGGTGLNSVAAVPADVDIRAMTNQANISLVPVLQINEPDATAAGTVNGGPNNSNNTNWMFNPAQSRTYNLVAAIGDTPSRPGAGNGGLQNLVGVLENWKYPTARNMNISGAFIQLGRSKYATAPRRAVRDTGADSELFGYKQKYPVGEHNGTLGYQTPPERPWGFDVGLLSQSPDLFAQKFTLPSSDNKPDEFFREVSRDDDWVKGLLCAKTDEDTPTNAVNRPSGLDCSGYE